MSKKTPRPLKGSGKAGRPTVSFEDAHAAVRRHAEQFDRKFYPAGSQRSKDQREEDIRELLNRHIDSAS